MKATMEVQLDAIWANRVNLKLEVELDNPDALGNEVLFETMSNRLHMMVRELRSMNERHIAETTGDAQTEARERLADEQLGG